MSWRLEGRPLRSVLVSRLRYLGDVTMSTVVLEVLRRGDPDLRLGFLCEAAHAAPLRDHPLLARRHLLRSRRAGADARARRPGPASATAAGRPAAGLVREVRRCRYDAAVDLFFNPRSAVLLRLCGARWRLGGGRSWRRRLYTHVSEPPTARERPRFRELAPGGLGDHLARLAPLRHGERGLPFLDWLEAEWRGPRPRPRLAVPAPGPAAEAALAAIGIAPGRPYLLLAPGATWADKEWPPAAWLELLGRLGEAPGLPAAVLRPPAGGERFATLGAAATAAAAGGGLLPGLPLGPVLELVGGAALVLGVDGGIVHAAVGMDRPTLALFGPTDPGIWFPYEGLGPFRVLRAPAAAGAGPSGPVPMSGLDPAAVAAVARELIAGAGRPAPGRSS